MRHFWSIVCGIAVACGALLWQTSAAQAYGPTGHRVIAELASRYMTSEAKTAVAKILGDELMAEAATWPDEMRASPDKFWSGEAYTYHFINLPDGITYEESEKNPAGDALTALELFSKTLKDANASAYDKRVALSFIIHIIGDLHQPLHAGRKSDWGGNKIDVVWFEKMTNLHMVWDEHLIDHKKLSYTEWTNFLGHKIKPAHITEWQAATPLNWVEEDIAMRGDIYENGQGILSWEYVYKYTPVIKSQLSKGGVRLAGYLNALFSGSPKTE